jgi:hypothetical protein
MSHVVRMRDLKISEINLLRIFYVVVVAYFKKNWYLPDTTHFSLSLCRKVEFSRFLLVVLCALVYFTAYKYDEQDWVAVCMWNVKNPTGLSFESVSWQFSIPHRVQHSIEQVIQYYFLSSSSIIHMKWNTRSPQSLSKQANIHHRIMKCSRTERKIEKKYSFDGRRFVRTKF